MELHLLVARRRRQLAKMEAEFALPPGIDDPVPPEVAEILDAPLRETIVTLKRHIAEMEAQLPPGQANA